MLAVLINIFDSSTYHTFVLAGCYTFLGPVGRALQGYGCSVCRVGERVPNHILSEGVPSLARSRLTALPIVASNNASEFGSRITCTCNVGCQVEAEELSDVSEEYSVAAVPFFAILKVSLVCWTRWKFSANHSALSSCVQLDQASWSRKVQSQLLMLFLTQPAWSPCKSTGVSIASTPHWMRLSAETKACGPSRGC